MAKQSVSDQKEPVVVLRREHIHEFERINEVLQHAGLLITNLILLFYGMSALSESGRKIYKNSLTKVVLVNAKEAMVITEYEIQGGKKKLKSDFGFLNKSKADVRVKAMVPMKYLANPRRIVTGNDFREDVQNDKIRASIQGGRPAAFVQAFISLTIATPVEALGNKSMSKKKRNVSPKKI